MKHSLLQPERLQSVVFWGPGTMQGEAHLQHICQLFSQLHVVW